MTAVERRFHETWLGMVEPVEGLVVLVAVERLVERSEHVRREHGLERLLRRRQRDVGRRVSVRLELGVGEELLELLADGPERRERARRPTS